MQISPRLRFLNVLFRCCPLKKRASDEEIKMKHLGCHSNRKPEYVNIYDWKVRGGRKIKENFTEEERNRVVPPRKYREEDLLLSFRTCT